MQHKQRNMVPQHIEAWMKWICKHIWRGHTGRVRARCLMFSYAISKNAGYVYRYAIYIDSRLFIFHDIRIPRILFKWAIQHNFKLRLINHTIQVYYRKETTFLASKYLCTFVSIRTNRWCHNLFFTKYYAVTFTSLVIESSRNKVMVNHFWCVSSRGHQ